MALSAVYMHVLRPLRTCCSAESPYRAGPRWPDVADPCAGRDVRGPLPQYRQSAIYARQACRPRSLAAGEVGGPRRQPATTAYRHLASARHGGYEAACRRYASTSALAEQWQDKDWVVVGAMCATNGIRATQRHRRPGLPTRGIGEASIRNNISNRSTGLCRPVPTAATRRSTIRSG